MNTTVDIVSANFVALSAKYLYDDNINITSNSITWKDGYTMYSHPAFNQSVDVSMNCDTIFYLASTHSLFDFISETQKSPLYLGTHVVFSVLDTEISNSIQYITNVNNQLFLTPLSSNDSYFRLIVNDDRTISLLQKENLYVTVGNKNPHEVTMENQVNTTEKNRQSFYLKDNGNNQIYLTVKLLNETLIGNTTYDERVISYSKVGPYAKRIRANGLKGYKNYLFNISNLDITFLASGFTKDHTWVKYYNELNDKTNNSNTEINETQTITGVHINHLFDLPFNSKINIDKHTMYINIANLKNIMTSNYEYGVKQ